MITNNFINFLKRIITINSNQKVAVTPVKNITGDTIYLTGHQSGSFPQVISYNVSFNTSSAGIYLGAGGAIATLDDYALDEMITSGINASVAFGNAADANDNPCIEFILTVTNTTNTDITIREIGYVQTLYGDATKGRETTGSLHRFLFDRTVLDSPITIEAGGVGALKYTLKSVI